jgi:hypothetical protein
MLLCAFISSGRQFAAANQEKTGERYEGIDADGPFLGHDIDWHR